MTLQNYLMTLLDYSINFVNSFIPFPYNIGTSFFILCGAFLVLFYCKHNREKVKKLEQDNYKKINSTIKSVMILTIVLFCGYYMWVHIISPDHLNPNTPNNHYRIAISPIQLSNSVSYDSNPGFKDGVKTIATDATISNLMRNWSY